MAIIYGALATLLGCAASVTQNERQPSGKERTIYGTMATTVTSSTDLLWNVEQPETDEAWTRLGQAAEEVRQTFEQIRAGGSGKQSQTWAADPRWQHYCDEVIDASQAASTAIVNRDLDALMEANDALYNPCEGCHQIFHPGIADP